jgi:hypothetical protein
MTLRRAFILASLVGIMALAGCAAPVDLPVIDGFVHATGGDEEMTAAAQQWRTQEKDAAYLEQARALGLFPCGDGDVACDDAAFYAEQIEPHLTNNVSLCQAIYDEQPGAADIFDRDPEQVAFELVTVNVYCPELLPA